MGILLRFLLLLVLGLLIVRAVWRVIAGMADGIARPPGSRGGPPERGVQMVRDPVCGTFLLPGSALTLSDQGTVRYFCSEKCREAYKARS
jgi:YHS domain-containing protein